MNKTLIILVVYAPSVLCQVQDSISTKATQIVYGEVASLLFWGFGSVNYERILDERLSVRVGIGTGYFSSFRGPTVYASGPVMMLCYSILGVRNRLEAGIGASMVYVSPPSSEAYLGNFVFKPFSRDAVPTERWMVFPAGAFGYRYQPDEGGFFFRAGLTFINYFGSPIQVSAGYVW